MNKLFFTTGLQKAFLLLVLLAFTCIAQAQPNYMTIFGDPLVAPCGTDYYHRLNCTATPTISGSTLSTINTFSEEVHLSHGCYFAFPLSRSFSSKRSFLFRSISNKRS